MPAARSNWDRVLQIGRWLVANTVTPYPVSLTCVKKIPADRRDNTYAQRVGYFGDTRREGRKILIRIAVRPGISRSDIMHTVLHEWAHAVSTRHDAIETLREAHGAHDDEWALAYGRLYRRFYDCGGCEESWEY